jgi:hypothetical protein
MDLAWDANQEPDLQHYLVHRGLSAGFAPDGSNLVTATPDTTAFDDGWDLDSGWYYKVAAVDVHGNVGGYALLEPGDVSGAAGPDLPSVTALLGNHPNPFNPGTVIKFDLGKRSAVKLEIFDLAGHRVRTLVDGRVMARGGHEEPWLGKDEAGRPVAAGVYVYRLTTEGFSASRSMMLVK